MEYILQYLWPYTCLQLVSLVFIWAALKKPNLARLLFVVLFAGAAFFNYYTALTDPKAYLSFAPMAYAGYEHFILGWFKEHIYLMVSLIALGQALIAVAMALKGIMVKLAVAGIVLFLLSIAPLGFGAAFPFSITVSIAALIILKQDRLDFLWKFKQQPHYEK